MRPDFQMKDKNENIVYDSKDYVYRSEEKEPDKLTTDEIAFEITTRKFKEMGFEGIINWVQNIAKEESHLRVLEQGRPRVPMPQAHITITWVTKDRRRRDIDNLFADLGLALNFPNHGRHRFLPRNSLLSFLLGSFPESLKLLIRQEHASAFFLEGLFQLR